MLASLTAQRSSFLHPQNQHCYFLYFWILLFLLRLKYDSSWPHGSPATARSCKYLLYLQWPDLICTKKTKSKLQTTSKVILNWFFFFSHFECKTNNRRGASPVVMWAMVLKTAELRGILSAKFSIHQTICIPTVWDLWPKASDWTYKQLKRAFSVGRLGSGLETGWRARSKTINHLH